MISQVYQQTPRPLIEAWFLRFMFILLDYWKIEVDVTDHVTDHVSLLL